MQVLDIEVDHMGTVTVLRPVGEMDATTVSAFRQALAEQATSGRLLIDMSQVPFVDSSALGALIDGIRRVREHGAAVAVVCSRVPLARLLAATGLGRVVTVASTLEEVRRPRAALSSVTVMALSAFGPGSSAATGSCLTASFDPGTGCRFSTDIPCRNH